MMTAFVSSVAVGASLSTSALFLGMGGVSPGIAVILGFSAPPSTAAELLHSVDDNGGRQ
jgi:hypothetical protein